jgi:signal transduction histidine kinase
MNDNGATARATAGQSASMVLAALAVVWALAGAGVVIGLCVASEGSQPNGLDWWLVAWLVVGVVDALAGAVLMTQPGHRRMAGCLIVAATGLIVVAVAMQARAFVAPLSHPSGWDDIVGAEAWARPVATGVLAALVPWELAIRGRPLLYETIWWSTAALVALTAIGEAADVRSAGPDVVDVSTLLVGVSATAATAHLVALWRAGDRHDPLPGWLAVGSVVTWLAFVPQGFGIWAWDFPGGDAIGALVLLATLPVLIVAVLVLALRDRPGRFHGVAHDVIGWLAFSCAIVLVYTGVVAGIGGLVGGDGPTWLLVATTGVIAVFAEPARRRIRDAVDRLFWGSRDDTLEVVRGVVDHVGPDSGDELLPALVVSLQRELHLEAVAIDVRTPDGWQREAASGPATMYERIVELHQRDEVVGRLVVGWEDGPSLRPRDERVLAELAGPLGLAVGWVRMAGELRRSSLSIVTTREEERRRLRRDLHDGMGPALTGVSLGLRTAVRQLERSPYAIPLTPSRELLDRVADEVDALVIEVKRVVRDLRPTALDQLGLVDAVGEFTRTFGDDLEFHLSMPSALIELPAAVEVAAYRIVTEAVTNVVRHAHASRCWLSISAGPTVDIDVVDDGIGVMEGAPIGVGWTAMRERATELGGSVQVTRHDPHGTRVHVRLPVTLP